MLVNELTVLVPAYNEAQRIEATLEKVLAFCSPRFARLEILVVDDGSTDGTGDLVAKDYAGRVRVVKRPQRGGKGAAVRTGVMSAANAWILLVDADLSIPIGEIEKLEPFAQKSPLVIGSKRAPGHDVDYPRARRFLGGIGQILISVFVVSGFHDTQCGFKLYRTDVARELFGLNKLDGFGFDFEILFLARRLGYSVSEVPIRCEHKIGGSVKLESYLRVLLEIGEVCWNRLRGAYPNSRA